MQKHHVLALGLALAFLGGCGSAPVEESSTVLLTGETVSGIITKVNGNEITLDLVTLAEAAAPQVPRDEETPGGSQAQEGESPSPSPGEGKERRSGRENGSGEGGGIPGGGPEGDSGGRAEGSPAGMSSFSGGNGGSAQRGYTRTGETALYQIPVGASVLTLTGTSRGFNSLSTDLLVTITFREDGVTPGQVQVIRSLS